MAVESVVNSVKNTSMENGSTEVLFKNIKHYFDTGK